jgi:hypothetical protein
MGRGEPEFHGAEFQARRSGYGQAIVLSVDACSLIS